MNALQRLLGRQDAPTPAPASDDLAARLDAMNASAATAKTPEQALAVMREAAGITNDLYKSFAAKPEAKEEAPAEPEKSDEGDKEAPADDAPAPESGDVTPADAGDEPTTDNPDDADLMADAPKDEAPENAPAAAPEAITAASGKEGESAPEEGKAPLAKSVPEILAQAQGGNGEGEPLMDASEMVGALLKSVAATQAREEQNAASLETILDYQEQLGTLFTKSIEGQKIIFERQNEISEQLARIEAGQTQSQEAYAQRVEELNKSVSEAMEGVGQYVQGIQRAPQGTPSGRAPLAPNSVAGVTLTDAVPVQGEPEYKGWTRATLKKSIEGHIRSDRCEKSGITTAHFLSIGKVDNLADLDPIIFQVAEAEAKRGTG